MSEDYRNQVDKFLSSVKHFEGATASQFEVGKYALPGNAVSEMTRLFLSPSKKADIADERGRDYADEYEAGYNESVTNKYMEAYRQGAQEERIRWRSILSSPEARGKQKTAIVIAGNTDMSPEAARALLKTVGAESGLDARMAGRERLDLDPDGPESSGRSARLPDPSAVYASRRPAGGGK